MAWEGQPSRYVLPRIAQHNLRYVCATNPKTLGNFPVVFASRSGSSNFPDGAFSQPCHVLTLAPMASVFGPHIGHVL
jgi:hypothetical protein